MSIYINFRASCLLSLCGRGKTGSVKDRSLYILSLRGGKGGFSRKIWFFHDKRFV